MPEGHAYPEMRRAYGEGRYAACREHAADLLDRFDGGVIEVRRKKNDAAFHCHCGKSADYYALEVSTL